MKKVIETTVILAAWNAEATLARSVGSALAQAGPEVEAIVVDDASRDGTGELARGIAVADPRARVLRLEENRGPAAARNRALAEARGEWVAVLDADDALAPGRLAATAAFARARGADVVLDNLARVDPAGAPLDARPYLAGPDGDAAARWDLERFLSGNRFRPGERSLGYLKPTFRRAFLVEHGLAYDETLRNSEDFHLIAECLVRGASLWFRPEPGYLYTVRPGSISHRLAPQDAAALLQAEAEFDRRHGPTLSKKARRLLRRRREAVADLASAEAAMTALKARRFGAALAALLDRPKAIRRFGRQFAEAVGKRLTPAGSA